MDHGHYPNDYVPSGDALFLARKSDNAFWPTLGYDVQSFNFNMPILSECQMLTLLSIDILKMLLVEWPKAQDWG